MTWTLVRKSLEYTTNEISLEIAADKLELQISTIKTKITELIKDPKEGGLTFVKVYIGFLNI